MYDSPVPSFIVSAVFGVMGLAIALALLLFILDHIEPVVERLLGGASFLEWLGGLIGRRTKGLRRRRRDADDEDAPLDASTEALLSILSSASLIVDADGDVIRANPQAYRLGIVQDDSIVNDAVTDAVRDVFAHGGRRRFDLETETPKRFIPAAADDAQGAAGAKPGVRRPNWLKVTVGRVGERFVVVLIDDVSETVRFAQIRDSFIINVSEQLLGPTKALGRLADDLERGEPDRDRIRADAHEVRSASNHLNHMVSDLLLLIKAQEPIVPSAANRLNVMEQVRAVVASLPPEIRDLGVEVHVDGDDSLVVNGDAGQIRTAIGKLVENAVEYSPRGGYVGVSVESDELREHAVIRVIDQGKGIPKREQSRIFERFYRGSGQEGRAVDGVGLGLSIVKHVALTHHGTVTVWSAPGQGSTFSFTLPVAR
ncbi:sensor histidine kinase [Bifidobacterium platyrrhinorum]|uniref:Sensor-like histidine kinase SenX3 n=1 Tax=Bifidobacterium platyrrhinorum TaxID=2661628 RepID=A0A6L9STC0_9BIFI|nr:ATP-binding protein [Bifidobacterium platyrrhinorum]NEG55800.1 ATPase [Bifidobacterium platyrrhinorum]